MMVIITNLEILVSHCYFTFFYCNVTSKVRIFKAYFSVNNCLLFCTALIMAALFYCIYNIRIASFKPGDNNYYWSVNLLKLLPVISVVVVVDIVNYINISFSM